MGAGVSVSVKRSYDTMFEDLPAYVVSELPHLPDGVLVQAFGHVECLDEELSSPFCETHCIAMDINGAVASWRSRGVLDKEPTNSYDAYATVLRATQATSFVLRDRPVSCLVESPDEQVMHVIAKEGPCLRVVMPSDEATTRLGERGFVTWLGHKKSERNLRYDPAHGVLLESQGAIRNGEQSAPPTAQLLAPGRTAPPNARSFWNEHVATSVHAVERWNSLVNINGASTWMRKYKVSEKTLRVGDAAVVIGMLRRAPDGVAELHAADGQPLLISNLHRTANGRPASPVRAPSRSSRESVVAIFGA